MSGETTIFQGRCPLGRFFRGCRGLSVSILEAFLCYHSFVLVLGSVPRLVQPHGDAAVKRVCSELILHVERNNISPSTVVVCLSYLYTYQPLLYPPSATVRSHDVTYKIYSLATQPENVQSLYFRRRKRCEKGKYKARVDRSPERVPI